MRRNPVVLTLAVRSRAPRPARLGLRQRQHEQPHAGAERVHVARRAARPRPSRARRTLTTTRVVARPVEPARPPGAGRATARACFVVEQGGRIRIVRDGALVATPFLDIASAISSGGERGLLGLAFHPALRENGRFYVNYTDRSGDTHIAEFRASPRPPTPPIPRRERELLFVRQPFANHNGGGLAFGPDGMLYIGLGDGGSGGDPQGNGQNLATLLGKMLRIDVDRGSPFARPARQPVRRAPRAPSRRSGPTACATPGASPSTARPATSSSATSARALSRRSTSRPRRGGAARTTAGT